ncbi:hypothetical protein [Mycobacteroides franklinii]|uniref:hypothetical protein n=1 Tax=Mycobacteroides franklinii TaxID=948102 RepID=UPI000991F9B3|nr:hypothetical protein [Mycobacteroides franklinii]
MSELLDRARASLEGVTEGPWLAILSDYDEESSVVSETERTEHGWGYSVAVDLLRSNAAFIAASRQLVPELIEAVEFLEPAVDHWKSLWQGTVKDSMKVMEERDQAPHEVERLEAELRQTIRTGLHSEIYCDKDCSGCVSPKEGGWSESKRRDALQVEESGK